MERPAPERKRSFGKESLFNFHICQEHGAGSMTVEHHEEYEIALIIAGRGAYQIESTLYAFQPGDMVFLRPNERHMCYGLEHKPFTVLMLLFDESIFSRFVPSDTANMQALLNAWEDCSTPFQHKISLSEQNHGAIKLLMEQMLILYGARELTAECKMNLLAGTAGAFLYQCSLLQVPSMQMDAAVLERRKDPLTSQAIAYINQHYSEEISLEILAKRLFVNPSYLSRTFKKNTGYTVVNYINLKRVTQARYYLSETDVPITQIAMLAGFNTISYFCVVFRRQVGCTPSVYRQQPEKWKDAEAVSLDEQHNGGDMDDA